MRAILADIVVAVHVAYISFIILGQLAILIGWFRRWSWVRNPWFRWMHFLMMAIVVGETLAGIECPLTTWEYDLRIAAGQNPTRESFIGRMLHDLIYIEMPAWGFTLLYCSFGAVILGSLIGYPPRRFGKIKEPKAS